jgi:hypothetical protein
MDATVPAMSRQLCRFAVLLSIMLASWLRPNSCEDTD